MHLSKLRKLFDFALLLLENGDWVEDGFEDGFGEKGKERPDDHDDDEDGDDDDSFDAYNRSSVLHWWWMIKAKAERKQPIWTLFWVEESSGLTEECPAYHRLYDFSPMNHLLQRFFTSYHIIQHHHCSHRHDS